MKMHATNPADLVLTTLVVPPPIVRPSITISEGSRARGQDDLTSKLCDIVKANATVRNVMEVETESVARLGLPLAAQQAVQDLQWHISTYFANDARSTKQSFQRSGLSEKPDLEDLKVRKDESEGLSWVNA